MGLGREEIVETTAPPVFQPGEKVMANRHVKNDGTYPRREIGDILVRKGDVGYVRDIGTFLQQFYVYAVEFVDRDEIGEGSADIDADAEKLGHDAWAPLRRS